MNGALSLSAGLSTIPRPFERNFLLLLAQFVKRFCFRSRTTRFDQRIIFRRTPPNFLDHSPRPRHRHPLSHGAVPILPASSLAHQNPTTLPLPLQNPPSAHPPRLQHNLLLPRRILLHNKRQCNILERRHPSPIPRGPRQNRQLIIQKLFLSRCIADVGGGACAVG